MPTQTLFDWSKPRTIDPTLALLGEVLTLHPLCIASPSQTSSGPFQFTPGEGASLSNSFATYPSGDASAKPLYKGPLVQSFQANDVAGVRTNEMMAIKNTKNTFFTEYPPQQLVIIISYTITIGNITYKSNTPKVAKIEFSLSAPGRQHSFEANNNQAILCYLMAENIIILTLLAMFLNFVPLRLCNHRRRQALLHRLPQDQV